MEGLSPKDTDRFLPLKLGATAHDTLQEFIDIDVTAEDLVGILNRNQAYKDLFARFVNQKTRPRGKDEEKGEKEAISPTHRLIGLLGMLGSRNLILSLRMHKAINGRFPVADDGTVDIKAGEYLKWALEAEEVFLRNKLEYSETAYAVGVYFDWAKRSLAGRDEFKSVLGPYCDRLWKRAMRGGLLGYFLAQRVRSLNPKQALAGGFLLQAGKIMMAATHADYPEFEEALVGTPLFCLLQERAKYGWAQEEIGAHTLFYFNVFDAIRPSIRHAREPYVMKGLDQMHYDLACVMYLADVMGRSWKIPTGPTDPVFAEWAHPSLKHLRLSADTLITVMKSAMGVR